MNEPTTPSRRHVLRSGAALAGAALAAPASAAADDDVEQVRAAARPRNGRVKQSIVSWCYEKHFKDVDDLCRAAVRLGCRSVELIDPKHWETLKRHGLTCAIAGSHGFQKGPCDPAHWDACRDALVTRIDQCAAAGVPSVITFTGMRTPAVQDPRAGMDHCVAFYKTVVARAEEKGVTICLEHLNSRDASHPMKGHPGYMGDHMDYCVELVTRVGSPRMKVLFDVYHVQVMDGDVIRRIRLHKDHIGHVHTAGCPGRGELDDRQEIQYAAVMRALLEVGYDGYVGQEFIPTRDAMAGLEQAVAACDV